MQCSMQCRFSSEQQLSITEYVRELSDEVGAIPFAMKSKFIAACERNIDMAELVHFLDDGGFLVLQHKNAVRTDDERLLDLSWREFVTLGPSFASSH